MRGVEAVVERGLPGSDGQKGSSDAGLVCSPTKSRDGRNAGDCGTSDVVVVVPTYNEQENIARLITCLRNLPEHPDILVVDDNSPDGTADSVCRLMGHDEGIFLLRRSGKLGLGSAYKAGFAFALRHDWQYICQMDADFSHDPRDISRLVALCREGVDVAIGSRYVPGGRISGWPRKRWWLSRCANLLAQTMLLNGIRDLTGGFKCFRHNALKTIDLDQVTSDGYIFQVEMNHRACLIGLKVFQIPICFTDRKRGQSKMGKEEAAGGLRQLRRLARDQFKDRCLQYVILPFKYFRSLSWVTSTTDGQ